MSKAASKGVLHTLIEDETAEDVAGTLAIPASILNHIFYIRGSVGVSAGAVILETASDPDYAGIWAPLVNDLSTPTTNPVVVVDEDEEIYEYVGALAAVRARISTEVADGTVSVFYMGK